MCQSARHLCRVILNNERAGVRYVCSGKMFVVCGVQHVTSGWMMEQCERPEGTFLIPRRARLSVWHRMSPQVSDAVAAMVFEGKEALRANYSV